MTSISRSSPNLSVSVRVGVYYDYIDTELDRETDFGGLYIYVRVRLFIHFLIRDYMTYIDRV